MVDHLKTIMGRDGVVRSEKMSDAELHWLQTAGEIPMGVTHGLPSDEAAGLSVEKTVELVQPAQVVTLRDGDLLVLRLREGARPSGAQMVKLRQVLDRMLPTGVKCLILEDGADFVVVRHEPNDGDRKLHEELMDDITRGLD